MRPHVRVRLTNAASLRAHAQYLTRRSSNAGRPADSSAVEAQAHGPTATRAARPAATGVDNARV